MHPSYYIICSVQLLRQLLKSRITCQVWGVKLHASVLACISDSHVVMRGPALLVHDTRPSWVTFRRSHDLRKASLRRVWRAQEYSSKKFVSRRTRYDSRVRRNASDASVLFRQLATPSMSLARFYSVACSGSALTLAPMIGLLLLRH
jgi:hypothetical protein